MNNTISQYIQIFDKRIFIDVADDGCGSGCVYCFTKHPMKPQMLLDTEIVEHLCDEVLKLPQCEQSIISLCPNTEPMKSKESIELIGIIIKKLSNKVKFIQISTKELIPEFFLEFLNTKAKFRGQIRISISLPYIQDVDILEPGAANVSDRLKNFTNIKKYENIVSILYLRPFNSRMVKDMEGYLELIMKYQPDDVCLGAEFVPRVDDEQLCTYMYDKMLAPDIFKAVGKEEIFLFADKIREYTHCKVFHSSLCNIANCSDYGCMLELHKYDSRYCVDCKYKCELLK